MLAEDGGWKHLRITLHPDSDRPAFESIVPSLGNGTDSFSVAAEMLLNGSLYSAKNYPEHLRRVRFNDPDLAETQVSLTQNFNVADTLASQVRPGAGSKNRLLPSLTITEPAYLRANRLSTRPKPPSSHGPAFTT